MPISAITVENFKGIKDPIRIELKPITLLFGPNSAGKSTVVQALHYAKEIFERNNLNPDRTLLGGDSIDLGGFESMVHQHDLSLPIRMKFDIDLAQEDLPLYFIPGEGLGNMTWEDSEFRHIPSTVESCWIEFTIRWSHLLEKPLLKTYTVGVNDEHLATIETSEDGKQINLSKFSSFHSIFLVDTDRESAFNTIKKIMEAEDTTEDEIDSLGNVFPRLFDYFKTDGIPGVDKNIPLADQPSALPICGIPLKIDSSAWSDDAEIAEIENFTTLLSSLITGPFELLNEGLGKFCYLGPLREVPKRGHRPSTTPDLSRWSNGLAAYDKLLFSDDEFIEKINRWLSSDELLNSGYRVEVKKYRELKIDDPLMLTLQQNRLIDEDMDFRDGILNLPIKKRLLIHDEVKDIELEPQDIGVGISQVLPVIVAALNNHTGFVAIEQPELHIHPALQVALGDLFIEQATNNQNICFLLETHSEHILLRLLRRIRETHDGNLPPSHPGLEPHKVNIVYVEQTNGAVSIRKLEISKDGDSSGKWPDGFFEERDEELF